MAAKIDKEMLKKHHFWLLFAPVGIFLLIAWYGLAAEVPDTIDDTKKKYETKQKEYAAKKELQPRKALDDCDKQLRVTDVQRTKMWHEGWAEQKDLFVWPVGYADQQKAIVNRHKFGDEIPEQPFAVRDQFRDPKVYPNEYKQLVKLLEPIQYRGGQWEKILRYKETWGVVPSSEDMWLAMEDLWVQRELLLAIHKVNVDAARFTKVDSKGETPLNRQFKSRLWEVDLQVVNSKDNKQVMKGKLKNVSGRLQVMGIGNIMKLKVMLSGKPFVFEIEGSPMEADEVRDVKTIERHTIKSDTKVSQIDGVEQLFDTRTVPVKRIDYVTVGNKLNDRAQYQNQNKKLPIRMCALSEDLATKEAALLPKSTTTSTPLATPMDADGDIGTTADTSEEKRPTQSANKFDRLRYIQVTPQIRRLPIGLVLITDQTFIKDILENLVAIKLRMQMTEFDWIRFHGTLDYGAATAPEGPMKRDFFLPTPAAGSTPNNNREDQFSANLMELSVYGFLTLYEKFDDKTAPKTPAKK